MLSAEHSGQRHGGEEEPRASANPALPAGTEDPAGDDGVDMEVAAKVLPHLSMTTRLGL